MQTPQSVPFTCQYDERSFPLLGSRPKDTGLRKAYIVRKKIELHDQPVSHAPAAGQLLRWISARLTHTPLSADIPLVIIRPFRNQRLLAQPGLDNIYSARRTAAQALSAYALVVASIVGKCGADASKRRSILKPSATAC